jgi:hypothetical protein
MLVERDRQFSDPELPVGRRLHAGVLHRHLVAGRLLTDC